MNKKMLTRYRLWMRLSQVPLMPMRLTRWRWKSTLLGELCGWCQRRALRAAAALRDTAASDD